MKNYYEVYIEYQEGLSLAEVTEKAQTDNFYLGLIEAELGHEKMKDQDICEVSFDYDELEKRLEEEGLTRFFFSERPEGFLKHLRENKIHHDLVEQKNKDWNDEWKKRVEEITIGDFRILPPWLADKKKSDEIIINPGQGFGTGSHETTASCIELLDGLSLNSQSRVLDFGCGSGILGICCYKKSKADITFIDIDQNALDNCQDNLDLNFPGGKFVLEKKERVQTYDLIFANLLFNLLIQKRDTFAGMFKKGSRLITSGVLVEQRNDFISYYEKKFQLREEVVRGEWTSCLWESL